MTKFKTKTNNKKAKAFRGAAVLITAAILALGLLLTGCPNAAGGSSGGSNSASTGGGGSSGGGGGGENTYAVTFGVEGTGGTLKAKAEGGAAGSTTTTSTIHVEKNKTVTFTAVPAANYKVEDWIIDNVIKSNTPNPYTHTVTKAHNIKVTFVSLPSGTASYMVKHYQEGTGGGYPAEPTETEYLSGAAGAGVAYTAKTYTGFTYKPDKTKINGSVQTSGTINSNGSTVVELYYERNTVSVTFKLAGGNVSGSTADIPKTGKYGTALDAPVPVRTGFAFKGWQPALSSPPTFPATAQTYTAKWQQIHTVNFGVSGTTPHGTLKAFVNNNEISSGALVEKDTIVTFKAEPASKYAVKKWTNNGSTITGAGTSAEYSLTVAANVNLAVHFQPTPIDVYVVTRGRGYEGKGYLWKNNARVALSLKISDGRATPAAVRAQGQKVYIVGHEIYQGVGRRRVWNKDGSIHWSDDNRWSYAYDIAFHNGKIFAACKTGDALPLAASLTEIGSPAVEHFLYKEEDMEKKTEAYAVCAGTGKLYAAGYKRIVPYKNTVFLWTKYDSGQLRETELGIVDDRGNMVKYSVCTVGNSVYVAAKEKVWKIDGSTVTPIAVSDKASGFDCMFVSGSDILIASGGHIWKITGTTAVLHKKLSSQRVIMDMCMHGTDLYAAGYYWEKRQGGIGYIYRPRWWKIASNGTGTVTEHELGTDEGEATGICVVQ